MAGCGLQRMIDVLKRKKSRVISILTRKQTTQQGKLNCYCHVKVLLGICIRNLQSVHLVVCCFCCYELPERTCMIGRHSLNLLYMCQEVSVQV